MASPGLTIPSTKEKIQNGECVHYLVFRFSVAQEREILKEIQAQIKKRGWQKLPDLENSFVWFGKNPEDVTDILQKSSFENHTCRYLIGTLTDVGQLEGTGISPERKQQVTAGTDNTPGLLKYFSKTSNNTSRALKMDDHGFKERNEGSD